MQRQKAFIQNNNGGLKSRRLILHNRNSRSPRLLRSSMVEIRIESVCRDPFQRKSDVQVYFSTIKIRLDYITRVIRSAGHNGIKFMAFILFTSALSGEEVRFPLCELKI